MHITIRRGLDIRIEGAPRQQIAEAPPTSRVAIQGADYPGLRPTLSVELGERVGRGQALFVDRNRPEIAVTASEPGEIIAIERGARRSIASIVIQRQGDDHVDFRSAGADGNRDWPRALMLESGLWPSFVTRPFGRIPDPDAVPDAIFVTAMDTNPLAADAAVVLREYVDPFNAGLRALERLTEGPVYVCHAPALAVERNARSRATWVSFSGPHPAGLPGTHIHHLAPVGTGRKVWQVGYQDVIALGALVETKRLWTERVVSLAGPAVEDPVLLRTRLGAEIDALTTGRLKPGHKKILSGSILSGRNSRYLGRYHNQITVLFEPDAGNRSALSRFLARVLGSDASTAIIPTEAYEKVLPLRMFPIPLLRALSVGDEAAARQLGCLELLEDDVALLSYVCPGRNRYGPLLRRTLDALEEAAE